jgi:hypothetical protein
VDVPRRPRVTHRGAWTDDGPPLRRGPHVPRGTVRRTVGTGSARSSTAGSAARGMQGSGPARTPRGGSACVDRRRRELSGRAERVSRGTTRLTAARSRSGHSPDPPSRARPVPATDLTCSITGAPHRVRHRRCAMGTAPTDGYWQQTRSRTPPLPRTPAPLARDHRRPTTTGNRQPATGNRQPATDIVASGPRLSDVPLALVPPVPRPSCCRHPRAVFHAHLNTGRCRRTAGAFRTTTGRHRISGPRGQVHHPTSGDGCAPVPAMPLEAPRWDLGPGTPGGGRSGRARSTQPAQRRRGEGCRRNATPERCTSVAAPDTRAAARVERGAAPPTHDQFGSDPSGGAATRCRPPMGICRATPRARARVGGARPSSRALRRRRTGALPGRAIPPIAGST